MMDRVIELQEQLSQAQQKNLNLICLSTEVIDTIHATGNAEFERLRIELQRAVADCEQQVPAGSASTVDVKGEAAAASAAEASAVEASEELTNALDMQKAEVERLRTEVAQAKLGVLQPDPVDAADVFAHVFADVKT